jgi:hypothetical protein
MRVAIAVVGVVAVGLIAASVLGVAGAETTTTAAPVASPPLRTVSVQGVAGAPVEPAASASAATAVYRQAMAAALADGQSKAQFLAEKAGATLGPVQSVGEGGGYIQCPEGEEYTGGQPDFGSGAAVVAAPAVALARRRVVGGAHKPPAPSASKRKREKRRGSARKSAVESCTLSTQLALVYQLS